jgi:hypothetical protein
LEIDDMKMLLGFSVALAALASAALALRAVPPQATGKPPPELKAEKWYNSAPLTLADLKGKAVLVQVFRTW